MGVSRASRGASPPRALPPPPLTDPTDTNRYDYATVHEELRFWVSRGAIWRRFGVSRESRGASLPRALSPPPLPDPADTSQYGHATFHKEVRFGVSRGAIWRRFGVSRASTVANLPRALSAPPLPDPTDINRYGYATVHEEMRFGVARGAIWRRFKVTRASNRTFHCQRDCYFRCQRHCFGGDTDISGINK